MTLKGKKETNRLWKEFGYSGHSTLEIECVLIVYMLGIICLNCLLVKAESSEAFGSAWCHTIVLLMHFSTYSNKSSLAISQIALSPVRFKG